MQAVPPVPAGYIRQAEGRVDAFDGLYQDGRKTMQSRCSYPIPGRLHEWRSDSDYELAQLPYKKEVNPAITLIRRFRIAPY